MLIFWCLILWGIFATLTGLVSNVPALMAIRFSLGSVEAAVLPSLLVLLNNWFTKSERSRANTMLLLGNPITMLWMSVLSGYLVADFTWRGMFKIEGIPAVVWSFAWLALVDDKPDNARWLPTSDKTRIDDGLANEQNAIAPMPSYRKAFRTPQVLVLWVCET